MKLDMRKGKEKESAKSDDGMTLGVNGGNPTDVTGNRETVRGNYEGIAKVLDSTGGKDTDRVNGWVAVLEAPDSDPASSCSVPAASSLGGYCHHDSAKNSSSILGHTIPLVASYVLINVHYLVKLFTTPLFLQILHASLLTVLLLAQTSCWTYPLEYLRIYLLASQKPIVSFRWELLLCLLLIGIAV